jgi:hypothetical protein
MTIEAVPSRSSQLAAFSRSSSILDASRVSGIVAYTRSDATRSATLSSKSACRPLRAPPITNGTRHPNSHPPIGRIRKPTANTAAAFSSCAV